MTINELKYKGGRTLLYLKTNAVSIIILLIASYFWVKSVTRSVEEVKVARSDTSTSKTTYITQPTVYFPQYTPYKVTDTVKLQNIIIPNEYKPSNDIVELKKQVTDLANKLYRANKYRDTIRLKDSTGVEVGNVNIEDSITQNMLALRKANYTLKFPEKTITITNTVVAPPKTQVFFGGGIQVSPTSTYASGADLGLMLKTKKQHLLGINGGFINVNGKVIPQAGVRAYWNLK